MMDEERGRITGIASVIIETDDLQRMTRFYRDVLGLAPRSEREEHTSFEWGDVRLLISVHSEVSGRNRDPLRILLNFTVDDIHAMHERLRSAGVEFSREPEQEDWGGWIATFQDPDGNTLQLFQLPDRRGM